VTGGYHYPDQTLLDTLYPKLAAKDGTPIQDILMEQETRLLQVTRQQPPQPQPLPAEESGAQQASQLPERKQPESRETQTTPTLPALHDDQMTLLTFLIANPDLSVSDVYKAVGIRAAKLSQIRQELTAQGFLQELAVRTGSTQGGRPVKYLIPTLNAWEVLRRDPPKGRGGAIHKHMQQMVVSGALAKGYSATIEQHLDSGGIVDMELQKGAGVKIAVEIAIASRPEREIDHYQHCLSAGYQVYGIFADDQLLSRTATLIGETFSAQDAGHIRLLPLRKLANLG
jgi:hypothetical protein